MVWPFASTVSPSTSSNRSIIPSGRRRGKRRTGNLDDTLATAELEILDETTDTGTVIPTIHLGRREDEEEPSLLTLPSMLLAGARVGIASISPAPAVNDTGTDSNGNGNDEEAPSQSPSAMVVQETTIVATPIVAMDFHHADEEIGLRSMQDLNERAAYISVTAFHCRNDREQPVGITIKSLAGKLTITKIRSNSIFADSPIQVGDELASINGKSCDPIMDGGQATRILSNIKGTISLVVSTGGKVGLIQCMLVKPAPECHTGLRLQYMEGKLQILRLNPTGLWSFSVLNEGNHILAINGMPCSQLDGPAAETLINSSQDRVTILAKSFKETSLVIEEEIAPCNDNNTSRTHRFFRRRIDKRFPNKPQKSRCALDYFGPCFHKVWSPAKIAHVFANVFVVGLSVLSGFMFQVGVLPMFGLVWLGIAVVNLPWIGWRDRAGAWCSIGQVISTIMILVGCAILLPTFFGSELSTTLGRNLGIAIPMTVIINLPMHFSLDNIEHYNLEGKADPVPVIRYHPTPALPPATTVSASSVPSPSLGSPTASIPATSGALQPAVPPESATTVNTTTESSTPPFSSEGTPPSSPAVSRPTDEDTAAASVAQDSEQTQSTAASAPQTSNTETAPALQTSEQGQSMTTASDPPADNATTSAAPTASEEPETQSETSSIAEAPSNPPTVEPTEADAEGSADDEEAITAEEQA